MKKRTGTVAGTPRVSERNRRDGLRDGLLRDGLLRDSPNDGKSVSYSLLIIYFACLSVGYGQASTLRRCLLETSITAAKAGWVGWQEPARVGRLYCKQVLHQVSDPRCREDIFSVRSKSSA